MHIYIYKYIYIYIYRYINSPPLGVEVALPLISLKKVKLAPAISLKKGGTSQQIPPPPARTPPPPNSRRTDAPSRRKPSNAQRRRERVGLALLEPDLQQVLHAQHVEVRF